MISPKKTGQHKKPASAPAAIITKPSAEPDETKYDRWARLAREAARNLQYPEEG